MLSVLWGTLESSVSHTCFYLTCCAPKTLFCPIPGSVCLVVLFRFSTPIPDAVCFVFYVLYPMLSILWCFLDFLLLSYTWCVFLDVLFRLSSILYPMLSVLLCSSGSHLSYT